MFVVPRGWNTDISARLLAVSYGSTEVTG